MSSQTILAPRGRVTARHSFPSTTLSIDLEASLGHRTRASMLRMAAGMDHIVDDRDRAVTTIESGARPGATVAIATELRPAQTLRFVKSLPMGGRVSGRCHPCGIRSMRRLLLRTGQGGKASWPGSARYLDDFWDRADVEVEGDPALQQAVRFAMFQVVQAGARAEQRAIPAKGLTGRGYDGHTFWDMETYTLPVLTYIAPHAVRDALHWRHSTLELARTRAQVLGLGGAAFPWRTIRGEECSGYWPAGTAAVHINADIADAVRRYVVATDDMEFEAVPDSSCSWKPRGCGARSVITTPKGSSGSTVSRAPTSTRRWWTTTCSPI